VSTLVAADERLAGVAGGSARAVDAGDAVTV
jgi:hypothetical protein